MRIRCLCLVAFLVGGVCAGTATAAPAAHVLNQVKAGELVIDPPTLINLGFEWFISGDDNHNAKVEVSYRKKGETAWKTAMPLMRIYHEHTYGEGIDVVQPNMFAGSILDL